MSREVLPVTIRRATEADIPAMVELLRELFAIEEDFAFDAATHARGFELLLARDSALILVAENRDAVTGMCSGQVVISTAKGAPALWIEDVVVSRTHRGRGIGARLMEAVEAYGRERGAARLQLVADTENKAAFGFYAAQGWRTTQLACLHKHLA